MTAAVYDLKIEQGEDWIRTWQLNYPSGNPRDLSGYTAHMQIRSVYYAASTLLDLTTTNGGITLGGALGSIRLALTDTQTASFFTGPSPNPVNVVVGKRPFTVIGSYDLRLIDPTGNILPVAGGRVLLSPSVTRPT